MSIRRLELSNMKVVFSNGVVKIFAKKMLVATAQLKGKMYEIVFLKWQVVLQILVYQQQKIQNSDMNVLVMCQMSHY